MLDKESNDILKFIQSNGKTKIEEIRNTFTNIHNIQGIIDFLKEIQYIKGITPKYIPAPGFYKIDEINLQTVYFSPYEITPKGNAYLESLESEKLRDAQHAKEKKKSNVRENLNTILAAIALIVAIIGLFCD